MLITQQSRCTPILLVASLLIMCILNGCTLGAMPTAPQAEQLEMESSPRRGALQVEPLPILFQQPTQFFVDSDDLLWVAQLNGGENEGNGQVVRVDMQTGEQEMVLDKLDKPTGIARVDDTLWVATRDAILKLNLANEAATVETVLSDLPNNGRSNGTLTVTPAGKLLYETSGNRVDVDSGKVWELDPLTNERRIVATGLKGGYAHVFDSAGRLWLTEIADGAVEGVTLPGEINLILPTDDEAPDFGWPRCYGKELAGPDCTGVRAAQITLPTHSTPTSIDLSPFSPNTLLVALWVTGEVIEVSFTVGEEGAVELGEPQTFLSELRTPQHIDTQTDNSVLISDFATGEIFRVWYLE